MELVLQGEIKQASPVYTKMVISIVLENIIAWKQLSRIKCPAQLFKLATLRLSSYGNLLISFMCETLATFILSHVRPSELQRKVIIRSTGMPNNTYSSEKEKHLGILKIISRMYTKSTKLQVLFLTFITWGWKCNLYMTSYSLWRKMSASCGLWELLFFHRSHGKQMLFQNFRPAYIFRVLAKNLLFYLKSSTLGNFFLTL